MALNVTLIGRQLLGTLLLIYINLKENLAIILRLLNATKVQFIFITLKLNARKKTKHVLILSGANITPTCLTNKKKERNYFLKKPKTNQINQRFFYIKIILHLQFFIFFSK